VTAVTVFKKYGDKKTENTANQGGVLYANEENDGWVITSLSVRSNHAFTGCGFQLELYNQNWANNCTMFYQNEAQNFQRTPLLIVEECCLLNLKMTGGLLLLD
jgi:hypothetical protein